MKRLACLAALAAVALSGCGDDNPHHVKSGVVMSKRYNVAQTYTVMICAGSNQYGCFAYVPITDTSPPDWSIVIRNCDMPHKPSEQPCFDGRIHLTQSDFDRYAVGVQYP